MNLLKFIRLHKGLSAFRRDWELCFGEDFQTRLMGGRSQFVSCSPIDFVLDEWREGELCKVDLQSRTYWNPNYVDFSIRAFKSLQDTDSISMTLASFARGVAKALNIDTRFVRVPDETSGVAALRRIHDPVFLSMATTQLDLEKHLMEIQRTHPESVVLTLMDFSVCMPLYAKQTKLKVECLRCYLDEDASPGSELVPFEGVSLAEMKRPDKNAHKSPGALVKCPDGAPYGDFHVRLITSSLDKSKMPHDDEIEVWYKGHDGSGAVRVSEISDFINGESFNVQWELLRWFLLGKGHLIEHDNDKRHTYFQRRKGLGAILNRLADRSPGEKAFAKGKAKHEMVTLFSAEVKEMSLEARLTRYNTERYNDEVNYFGR